MSEIKQCKKCQLVKKTDDFYKDKRRTNGIRALCIVCSREGKKAWREKNLARARKRGKEASKRYNLKHKKRVKQSKHKYYLKNRERIWGYSRETRKPIEEAHFLGKKKDSFGKIQRETS